MRTIREESVMKNSPSYPTDLTDAQWEKIEQIFLAHKPNSRSGRPRHYSYRQILNALFYQVRSGCAWRMLPHDFPKWESVYAYFRAWVQSGLLESIHDALREEVRVASGKEVTATAAIIDSQSAKTTQKGGSVKPVKVSGRTQARRSKDASAISL